LPVWEIFGFAFYDCGGLWLLDAAIAEDVWMSASFSLSCLAEAAGRDSPRQATDFLCFAKESKQRKATLLWASLRFATGNLRCSLFAGSAQTRCRSNTRGPHPRKAALLGTRRGEWIGPSLCSALSPSPACGGGLGWGEWELAGVQLYFAPACPHPSLPPQAGEGA
jgi:hypothetical protein